MHSEGILAGELKHGPLALIDENMPVIERIVPRVIALRPQLAAQKNDPEQIRGYSRIFTEAGETYRILLLQHVEYRIQVIVAYSTG